MYKKARAEVRPHLFIHSSKETDEEDVPGQLGVEPEVHHATELLNGPLIFDQALADY